MEETRSLFNRVISYTYQQYNSVSVHVPATQTASEKVTNMVGTFLNENSDEVQIESNN